MEPLTVLPAIVIVLIAAILGFWLFAPAKDVAASENETGTLIEKVVAKLGSIFQAFLNLFKKKSTTVTSTPAPTPAPAPIVETKPEISILPVNPPGSTPEEKKN
jgi:hypothetical protein